MDYPCGLSKGPPGFRIKPCVPREGYSAGKVSRLFVVERNRVLNNDRDSPAHRAPSYFVMRFALAGDNDPVRVPHVPVPAVLPERDTEFLQDPCVGVSPIPPAYNAETHAHSGRGA